MNILTSVWFIHGWTGLVIVEAEEATDDDHGDDHGGMEMASTLTAADIANWRYR